MDRYPQCRSCKFADFERLGKPKCKKDNKPIYADSMTFGVCKNYKPKEKPIS